MSVLTNADIGALLEDLNSRVANDLETQWLEFKPRNNPREDMKVAVDYAVCFANAEGEVVVFGVADRTRGRMAAIHGASHYKVDT